MMSQKSEMLLAIGIFVFCVVVYFVFIPTISLGVDIGVGVGLISPRTFPKFIVAIIAGLSVMIAFNTIKNGAFGSTESRDNIVAFLNAGAVLLFGFIYIYLLEWIGYYLSTPLILFGLLWFFGARSWLKTIAATILTTIALAVFFGKVLNVMIPAGRIF